MKKTICCILILASALSLFACGKAPDTGTPTGGNAITAYFDKGYTASSTYLYENRLTFLFVSPEKTDFVKAEIKLTGKETKAYEALDYSDEDYEKNERAFFASLSGKITVTDMNDRVPPAETINALIGKTPGELEALGYDQSSVYSDAEDNLVFVYSDEAYNFDVIFEGDYKALFDIMDADFASLKVKTATFASFNE